MRYPQDDRGRFISGIHNYCDSWCERCRFTDRCRVHQMEQDRQARRLLRGGDPETPEEHEAELRSMMEDLLDSVAAQHDREEDGELLPAAFELPEELPEPSGEPIPPRKREPDPLAACADAWSVSLEAFLKRVRGDLPELGYDLEDRKGATPRPRPGVEPAPGLAEVGDALEVLHYFTYFVPVKTRWVTGFPEWNPVDEIDDEPGDDQIGTARLVYETLGRCSAALWACAGFHLEWTDAAVSLANEAEAMRREIDARYPRHRTFIRPGLDEL